MWDIITSNDLNHIFQSTGCSSLTKLPDCPKGPVSDLYRTINGQCNNRISPLLGASDIALKRWLRAEYEDGFSLPRGSSGKHYSGYRLPPVRVVSNKIVRILRDTEALDFKFTQMLMQWGQWIDHDLSFTVLSGTDGINCGETCSREEPCFPIEDHHMSRSDHDPTFTQPNECLPFFRSAPACVTQQAARIFGQLCVREQLNSITSFIDANMVYGSTEAVANTIRDQENDLGLLRVNKFFTDNGLELLPFVDTSINPCGQTSCKTSDKGHSGIPCFHAGDNRVNEHIRMSVLHTLFLRQHNRLARELKKLNPHWDGETIYQETRKIMGAVQQVD
ncbi:hypothetical protein scyTo_0010902 [Scyliorhinus torazame]|uniref:Uncharacterized protein n=1 Tax=Scyliorhinus torazame TaxID=75743 RepID=A0A401PCZ5_SCYTO|nr:hypothetical protein [Scyliorhinus torazame]